MENDKKKKEFFLNAMNLFKAKYQIQYDDYSDDEWTVPVLLTPERISSIRNDLSVKIIRIIID